MILFDFDENLIFETLDVYMLQKNREMKSDFQTPSIYYPKTPFLVRKELNRVSFLHSTRNPSQCRSPIRLHLSAQPSSVTIIETSFKSDN